MHRELCGVLEVMLDERLVYRGTGSSTVIAKQREGRKRACSTTENGSESLREHPGVIIGGDQIPAFNKFISWYMSAVMHAQFNGPHPRHRLSWRFAAVAKIGDLKGSGVHISAVQG